MATPVTREYSLVEDPQMPVATTLVAQHLAEIWKLIQTDNTVRSEAAAAGVNLASVTTGTVSPFTARKDEGLDAVTLILIAATGRVVGEIGVRGLDWLWENVIAPRLSASTGLRSLADDDG